jgi:hypothetical protein
LASYQLGTKNFRSTRFKQSPVNMPALKKP